LARAGVISTSLALTTLSAYRDEENYTVFTGVSSNLSELWNLVKREKTAEPFKVFARSLFIKQGKALGWDPKSGESHLTTMVRTFFIIF
jgi:puromycin-sensitive aminopeptidase